MKAGHRDFFTDNYLGWRSLMNDSFKSDVKEDAESYTVEAELPGIKRMRAGGGLRSNSIIFLSWQNEPPKEFNCLIGEVHFKQGDGRLNMLTMQSIIPIKCEAVDEKSDYTEKVYAIKNTLYAAAMAITQNAADAEDAVQEAVLRGWIKLDSLKEPEYLGTWLTRIVINSAINQRKKKRSAPLLYDVPAGQSGMDERIDIRRAIAALDEKTRLVTVLYYFEGLPVEQVAKVLGIRLGTVKSRLYRARAKLREVLEGYDHDE